MRQEEAKSESDSEPVVAELFEQEEPPVEVVDVEVITVVEADTGEEAEAQPERELKVAASPEPSKPDGSTAPAPKIHEFIPRRNKPIPSQAPATEPSPRPEAQRAKKRTPAEAGYPVRPRKKTAPQEPTIIIPTGATASGITAPTVARARTPTRPVKPDRRRARENTLPMEPVPLPGSAPSPAPESGRHRQVTQPLPRVSRTSTSRTDASQLRVTQRSRQPTQESVVPAAVPTSQPAQQPPPKEKGYTFGDVLRSFPSTIWTLAAGLAVLIIFAFLFIGAISLFSDSSPDVADVPAALLATPTLDAGLAPDATPTPGPTPTDATGPVITPTPVSNVTFSSPDLGFTLEYPENWQNNEDLQQAIFSPSAQGLDPNELQDTNMRIGIPTEESLSISELLTTVLATFPSGSESLNEGTISIASQTWTSTQIRFDNEDLGGQGIATVAVTNKDGVGYFLIAVAPAEEWNSVQPVFQEMINSFRFSVEDVVARTTPEATIPAPETETELEEADPQAESTPAQTQLATPTPESGATPVVYVIQSGDTLLEIAAKFGVDVDLLASENGITNPEGLQVGQELVIPFTAEELAAFTADGQVTTISAAESESESTESTAENVTEAPPAEEVAPAPAPDTASTEPDTPVELPPLSGKIVYPAFNPGTNTYDLWIVDLTTGEQTGFTGNASQPSFNKDGTLLAYRSWDLGTRGIFFQDFVGGRGGIVTRFVEDGLPTWAPDGFTFAFSSRKEGDRVPRLYVGNQLGEDAIGLSFQGEYPSTLPDGRLVAKGCTPTGDCGIFLMGPRGGGETKIGDDPGDTAPAASPDGTRIAFMSAGRGTNNWEIFVMNADGSNPRRLTENGNNDGLPTWSPDSQSIAWVSDQGGVWAVWAMNADGSGQRKLFDMRGSPDGVVLHDEPNSKGWLEERISWAP